MRLNLFGIGTKSESPAVTAQERINCLILPQVEMDRTAFTLIGRPGLSPFAAGLGANPSRGMWAVNSLSTPLLFSVHGDTLHSIDNGGAVSTIGTLSTSSGDVSIADDGQWLVLVDGTNGYYYDMLTPGAFTTITDGNFTSTPETVTYQDTYFVVTSNDSRQFQLSDNNDPATWPAINIGFAGGGGGHLVAGRFANNILQLFGGDFSEYWQNSGGADLPYSRIPGAAQEFGLASAWSLDLFDNSLVGLFVNKQGARDVSRMRGYSRMKLSDSDIDDLLADYGTISDAQGFATMSRGHPLYVLNLPTQNVTHVYDGLANAWCEWQDTDGNRFWGQKFAKFIDKLLVADRRNGNIYSLDTSVHTDDGSTIPMEVTSKHLWMDDQYVTVNSVQIDMEQGVGTATGQGADPVINLLVSKDGGNSFTSVGFESIGKVGEYTERVKWDSLGTAFDWVFRLRIADPVKRVITGASAEITVGGR
jgi:hypothetical protein